MKKILLLFFLFFSQKHFAQQTVPQLLQDEKVITLFQHQKDLLDRLESAYSRAYATEVQDTVDNLSDRFDTLFSRTNHTANEISEIVSLLDFHSEQDLVDFLHQLEDGLNEVEQQYDAVAPFYDTLNRAFIFYANGLLPGTNNCELERIGCRYDVGGDALIWQNECNINCIAQNTSTLICGWSCNLRASQRYARGLFWCGVDYAVCIGMGES